MVIAYDVTDVQIDPDSEVVYATSSSDYRIPAWSIRFQCGKGGIVVEFDNLHMNDILSDGGVQEAGDISQLKTHHSRWQPTRFRSTWRTVEVDEIYVNDGEADGPEAIVRVETTSGTTYELALTAQLWVKLCQIAAQTVGHPWFNEMRRSLGTPSLIEEPLLGFTSSEVSELMRYMFEQTLQLPAPGLRNRTMPRPPWPTRDNPMLAYLIKRAIQILEVEGAGSAITWLAAHAWREGHLEGLYAEYDHGD